MDVRLFEYRSKRDLLELVRLQATTDCTICWFALGYATSATLIAKLVSKPIIIIIGGWDVAAEKELAHGAMLSGKRRLLTKLGLEFADRLVAVSNFAKTEAKRWVERPISVIYNGVDVSRFLPRGVKTTRVATALGISDSTRFRTKGADLVLETARLLPSVPFDIYGRNSESWQEKLHATAPSNVTVHNSDDESLWLTALQESKVYLQPSRYESFGIAVAEAMACGCVPVVSAVGGLPEVVGDCGFLLRSQRPEEIAQTLGRALESQLGSRARKRVEDLFALDRRAQEIMSVVTEVVAGSD